jgi:hypothetical protein
MNEKQVSVKEEHWHLTPDTRHLLFIHHFFSGGLSWPI